MLFNLYKMSENINRSLNPSQKDETAECAIAVCGPVDAGKSSLIGVLTSGQLDNGRGWARNKILIHPHERETGRTSHISYNPLIYNRNSESIVLANPREKSDNLLNFKMRNGQNPWVNKVVSFIDLAGHEKYLKTTIFGVTGLFPDYGIVVIGANTGITKLTREHLGILLYLKVPIIITITKVDLAPRQVYQNLCNQLKKLLGRNTYGKVLYFISDSEKKDEETDYYLNHMIGNPDIIPIISISNKDGTNIENLHRVLYSLPPRDKWSHVKTPGSVYYIDSVFVVQGIGMVLSGINKGNPIKLKQKMYLGPFNGQFKEIQIRSIHNSLKQNVDETSQGVQSCIAIKAVNQKEVIERSMIRKGMVVIDDVNKYKNNVVKSFYSRINILHHATTIKTGYSPVIHCGPIRQAAQIDLDSISNVNENDKKLLRSGDNKIVKFTFNYHPEFMEENMIFFFREGTTKGVGEVLKITDTLDGINLEETSTINLLTQNVN
jgi:GTPase